MKNAGEFNCIYVCIFLFCIVAATNTNAQQKVKVFYPVHDTLYLDSLPVSIRGLVISNHGHNLEFVKDYVLSTDLKSVVIFHPANYDTLKVIYMHFPAWIEKEKWHRKPNITGDVIGTDNAHSDVLKSGDQSSIVTDGILLRGISFGNAQDLVLNSSLNLRMNGRISKDISIEAAVTDQEFPFQPEGTTSNLQDFDRIYVQLRMPRISVLLGDHPFTSPSQALFMKYAKKDRGLQLLGTDTLGKILVKWEAAAALARGRFSRNEINGIEGQQGPYRLQGAKGEQFIIIVSGTEVVYLDGKKMERGLQGDYVIDYNVGEVTFTPKHIINAFSRIVAEFQYSDRNYTRSVAGANANFAAKKWEIFTGVYSEQDARNQPIQQDLNAFDSASGLTVREILQKAGDNPNNAVLASAHASHVFSNSVPNYIKRDTGSVHFYEYISGEDTFKTFYTVNFSYQGPGKGHYVLKGSVANGKAYRYVGEISGVPAGDYEPITQIQAPGRLSMAETGIKLKPRNGTLINTNIAYSSRDNNLFSPIDDGDNRGAAAHLSISDLHNLGGRDSAKKWYWLNKVEIEKTTAHFNTIERYRDVEFGRQWNHSLYNPENGATTQASSYVTAYTEVGKGNGFAFYLKGGNNQTAGNKISSGTAGFRWNRNGFFITPQADLSQGVFAPVVNNFKRGNADFGYKNALWKIQFNGQQEQSRFDNSLSHEIKSGSYGFKQTGFILEHNGKIQTLNLNGSRRTNQNIRNGGLQDAVLVNNANLEWTLKGKKTGFLKLVSTYRTMKLKDTFFKNLYADENHLAGRMEYNFTKILRIFAGNMYYQTISGREQQRQYSYFEVPAGQGFYTWVDFNGNGVKEVNEFQETTFKDQARYVRLLVPTGTYIKAQGTEFAGNLTATPKLSKKKETGRLQNRFTWNYTGKSTETNWYQRISPFFENNNNPGLLAYTVFLRNLLEFESKTGKYLVQYTYQKRGNKLFFTNGFDTRKSESHILFFRGNASAAWQIRNTAEYKQSGYKSEYIPLNGFDYTHQSVEPAVTWQPTSKFRISIAGKASKDRSAAIKVADQLEAQLQITKTVGKGGILEAKISSLNAKYYMAKGTPLSYDVLQGFSAGQNFRGTLDLRFNAGRNIQMVISYEGRKTAEAKIIHIGRAEARYLF